MIRIGDRVRSRTDPATGVYEVVARANGWVYVATINGRVACRESMLRLESERKAANIARRDAVAADRKRRAVL